MEISKSKLLAVVVTAIAVFTFSQAGMAAPYNNGYTFVWLLGHNALKFADPVDFNNSTLTNFQALCFGTDCRTSWANVTANLSGTLPFSSITGTIFPYQIANSSIDQSKLGGLTLPFFNITGTIDPNQIAASSIAQTKLGGITIPASNVTPGTFGSNSGTGDYIFPRNLTVDSFLNVSGTGGNSTFSGDVQIIGKIYGGSPVKIAGGINVTSGQGYFGDIIVTSCNGCENFTAINSTLNVLNSSMNNINSTVNVILSEQTIIRNYTITMNSPAANIVLPIPNGQSLIYFKGEIPGLSGAGALTMQINDDNQTNYMYKRINGLQFLYQAVTVNPQRNVTMEGYTTIAKRTIELTLYVNSTVGTHGDYKITSYGGLTNTFITTGSFEWTNLTMPNFITIYSGSGSNLLNGTYFIADMEK